MAQNNTPIAEPMAVAAVGEEPVIPQAVIEASNEATNQETQNNDNRNNESRNNDSRNNDNRGNDSRDDRDDDRDSRRGNRDRDRDDRDRGAGRLQGPTDLMPELDPSQEGELQQVEDGRAYEISYIVNPANGEAIDATQARVKEILEGAGGAVDNSRVTESRRLAFPIKKQTEGIYVVINARFNQSLIPELDRYFKLEDSVLRHIVLREGR